MLYLPMILIGMVVLIIITRPFTILFHELGHALSAMIMTQQGATIYVGSYGSKKHSCKITIRGLEIWLRYNPIKWQGGLCIPRSKELSITKQYIFVLSGVLFSLYIASILIYVTFTFDLHGSLKLICAFAFGSTIIDLFNNLIPRNISLADGTISKSDGYYLYELYKRKKYYKEYISAFNSYSENDYKSSVTLCDMLINKGIDNEHIYRLGLTASILNRDYEKAQSFRVQFEKKFVSNSDDYYNFGLISFKLNLFDEAQTYFNQSLSLNQNHSYTLNALGDILNSESKFLEAITLFDKAILSDPDMFYAYNNRGFAKIEMGDFEEGLKDIEYSINLNKDNSYGYRNLGIYFLKTGDNAKALDLFMKAKEIDVETDSINEYIHLASMSN